MRRLTFLTSRFFLVTGFMIATMPCVCESMVEKSCQAPVCHESHCDHDSNQGKCDHCDSKSFHACMNQKAETTSSVFSLSLKAMGLVPGFQEAQKSSIRTRSVIPTYSPPQSPPSISILRI